MPLRYALLLVGLLTVPAARAQQPDTLILRADTLVFRGGPADTLMLWRHPGWPSPLPGGGGIDEEMIIRPGDDDVYFIRRFRTAPADSVHPYIRRLPPQPHPWPPGFSVPDSLRSPFVRPDSLYGELLRARPDSSARHVFRLADSLRGPGPRHWMERMQPGARLEWGPEVEIETQGDTTRVWRHRRALRERPRVVVRRGVPEMREDGVLVVPDGRGGTWIYLPPDEREDE